MIVADKPVYGSRPTVLILPIRQLAKAYILLVSIVQTWFEGHELHLGDLDQSLLRRHFAVCATPLFLELDRLRRTVLSQP